MGDRFQFLGIPPKGEHPEYPEELVYLLVKFPISRDPPEGGTSGFEVLEYGHLVFPISRDPPKGELQSTRLSPPQHGYVSNF